MPEWIKEQLKQAARELLSRPPALRGPFFVSEKKLREFLDENYLSRAPMAKSTREQRRPRPWVESGTNARPLRDSGNQAGPLAGDDQIGWSLLRCF